MAPSEPLDLEVIPSDGGLLFQWAIPQYNGGAPETNYHMQLLSGSPGDSSKSTIIAEYDISPNTTKNDRANQKVALTYVGGGGAGGGGSCLEWGGNPIGGWMRSWEPAVSSTLTHHPLAPPSFLPTVLQQTHTHTHTHTHTGTCRTTPQSTSKSWPNPWAVSAATPY
jgi:hypothetical protein